MAMTPSLLHLVVNWEVFPINTTHAITTYFTIVILCPLFLVCLLSLYLELSFTLTSQIRFIYACWSATSFSFLTHYISLPYSILHHTELLYSLPLIVYEVHIIKIAQFDFLSVSRLTIAQNEPQPCKVARISLLVSNCTCCMNLLQPA